MEPLLADLISRLTDLQPQLQPVADLAAAQGKAEEALADAKAQLEEAKNELKTTRSNAAKAKADNEKTFGAAVFDKNKEAEALDARCSSLQTKHNSIQSEISAAVQFQNQLTASMASLMKSVG